MASINVDVDIDDILWDMTNYEKQELADELYDAGFVPKQMGGVREDEETILRITNKLV